MAIKRLCVINTDRLQSLPINYNYSTVNAYTPKSQFLTSNTIMSESPTWIANDCRNNKLVPNSQREVDFYIQERYINKTKIKYPYHQQQYNNDKNYGNHHQYHHNTDGMSKKKKQKKHNKDVGDYIESDDDDGDDMLWDGHFESCHLQQPKFPNLEYSNTQPSPSMDLLFNDILDLPNYTFGTPPVGLPSNQSIHSTNVLPFDKTKTKTKIMKNKKIIISDDIETEPDTDTDDVIDDDKGIQSDDGNSTSYVTVKDNDEKVVEEDSEVDSEEEDDKTRNKPVIKTTTKGNDEQELVNITTDTTTHNGTLPFFHTFTGQDIPLIPNILQPLTPASQPPPVVVDSKPETITSSPSFTPPIEVFSPTATPKTPHNVSSTPDSSSVQLEKKVDEQNKPTESSNPAIEKKITTIPQDKPSVPVKATEAKKPLITIKKKTNNIIQKSHTTQKIQTVKPTKSLVVSNTKSDKKQTQPLTTITTTKDKSTSIPKGTTSVENKTVRFELESLVNNKGSSVTTTTKTGATPTVKRTTPVSRQTTRSLWSNNTETTTIING